MRWTGLSANLEPSDFDQEDLKIGMKIEMEHTDDPEVAIRIAMDHLTEDPDYYQKLLSCVETERKVKENKEPSMGLHHVKTNITNVIELLSVAQDEQDADQTFALISEALSFAHDAFEALEGDEEEEEEEGEAEDEDEESARMENPSYFTKKQERQYEAIKASVLGRGGSLPEAKRIAAATVNRDRAARRSRR